MNTKPQLRPLASYLTLGPAGLKDLSDTPDADSIITATLNLGDLLLRKNSFYGGSFRNKSILSNLPAEEAIKLRIDDKLKRLKRNLDNPENGDPEDTINDLAGYFLLWGIVRQMVQPQTPADVVRQQQEASQSMFTQGGVHTQGTASPAVAISTGVGGGGVKRPAVAISTGVGGGSVKRPVESSRSSADMAGGNTHFGYGFGPVESRSVAASTENEIRCPMVCPHGDQCTRKSGHQDGCNHAVCPCNEPNSPIDKPNAGCESCAGLSGNGPGDPGTAFAPAIITAEDILRETNIAFRHGSIETPGVKAKILDMILHYKITLNLYGRERHTCEHHLVCTVEDFLKHGPDGAKLLIELTVRDYIQSIDLWAGRPCGPVGPVCPGCPGTIPAPGTKVKIETIADGVYLITTSRG